MWRGFEPGRDDVREAVGDAMRVPRCRVDARVLRALELMEAAFETGQRWKISYWDATIIEAARTMGCTEVLSEDLSHEQDYGGIRVANPLV